jgi:eukaryotic-like serine/threonine-protein kinase
MPVDRPFLRQVGTLHFGDFTVDVAAGKLRKNGTEVHLQGQPFQILSQLTQRAGEVVTRDELRRQVWSSDTFVDFDNSLNTAINKIREALGDSAEDPQFIETLPRRGYRFIAHVEVSKNGHRRADALTPSDKTEAEHRPLLWVVATLLLGIALGGVGFWAKEHYSQRLTDKDTVVLADFDNRTGEPVFDNTLEQALAVQLQQSPFLSLVPAQQSRETLRFMGRPAEEHLIGRVAQEVCEREGANAFLQGTITNLGTHYVLDLNAVNCRTGNSLAQEESEVDSKEHVLAALGDMATRLRSKLGESLAQLEKYDTPILQATTPSLDALKAYSNGILEGEKLNAVGGLPFFKRAIELDPDFALAYVGEAMAYDDTGEFELARVSLQKAYDLRKGVSEQEKRWITALYHDIVTGDSLQILEANRLWAEMYPRDRLPHDNLAGYYNMVGAFDKALQESSAAVRIAPRSASGYVNLASAYFGMNRWQESRAALEPIVLRGQGDYAMYCFLYVAAWAQDDQRAMRNYLNRAQEDLSEGELARLQFTRAEEGAYYGKLHKAHEIVERSEQITSELGLNQTAEAMSALEALWLAEMGNRSAARELAKQSLAKSPGLDVAVNAALALAAAGDFAGAEEVAQRLAASRPQDTLLNAVSLPLIHAGIALRRGNPTHAIDLLKTSQPYELGFGFSYYPSFMPTYIRGQAYLNLRDGSNAAAEFRKLLDHRGLDPVAPIYALAHLELGRAYALAGDLVGARSAYEDFISIWKDADPDIPILKEAKAEYARLQ